MSTALPLRPIPVALLGVGGVGRAILSQLLSPPLNARFQLICITNSRLSLSLPLPAGSAPLTPVNTIPVLEQHGAPLDVPSLLSILASHPDAPGVLVDATGAASIPEMYPQMLRMGVHVVTPNKKGASGPAALWDAVVAAAYPYSPATYYGESTVGAGLPILQTLKDLVATGDEIEKIEGVFSGTLSYIFNEFSQAQGGDVKFSEVVKVAKDKGYTVSAARRRRRR
jgi:homoserine dehydrogenase